MLGVALGAIIVGCLLMLLLLNRYDFKIKVSTLAPSSPGVMLVSHHDRQISTYDS
jgi:hypothetical protein